MSWTIDFLCRVFSALMVGCLVLMVVMVFGNVVLRYGFGSAIMVSEELSRWLFVWLTFLGAVVALRNQAHLATDAFLVHLPQGARRVCFVVARVLMLFVCVLMLRGAWRQAAINWGTTSAVMQIPITWLYASGVVFALVAIPILLQQLWQRRRNRGAATT